MSYQINNDGTVVGNYSNEQEQVLGQIVLANFANNEGLASGAITSGRRRGLPGLRCWGLPVPATSVS